MLLVTSEGMVLLLEMLSARQGWIDWESFALVSFFVQWVTLSSAALICGLRQPLTALSVAWSSIAILVLIGSNTLLFSLIGDWIMGQDTRWNLALRNVVIGLLITGLVLRYFYLQFLWKQERQAQMEASLSALQARIHPHFLFNAMNAIASLIGSNPARAEEAVLSLSDLFRASLSRQDRLVPLKDELLLCRRYLELEALRLGDRLNVVWNIQSEIDNQAVAPLSLQPLMENAIYHGIQQLPEGGNIEITGVRRKSHVYLTIRNPVPPASENASDGHQGNQIAVSNTQARLRALFGETAVLKHSRQGGIYTVMVRLPWRTMSDRAARQQER